MQAKILLCKQTIQVLSAEPHIVAQHSQERFLELKVRIISSVLLGVIPKQKIENNTKNTKLFTISLLLQIAYMKRCFICLVLHLHPVNSNVWLCDHIGFF